MRLFNLETSKFFVDDEQNNVADFPIASKRIRMDLLRFIAGKADMFRDQNKLRVDTELQAAAHRYGKFVTSSQGTHIFVNRFGVMIVVYDITLQNGTINKLCFEPLHISPKATFYLCRRGSQYLSSSKATQDEKPGICANCDDDELMDHLKNSAHHLFLRVDGPELATEAESDEMAQEALDPIALLDGKLLLENKLLERSSFLDQDFFLAFAKQMQVGCIQSKTKMIFTHVWDSWSFPD
jgi:hypothetical protein